MINLTGVLTSRAFAQPYSIIRSTGAFALGGFQSSPTTLPAFGPVTVAKEEELAQAAEGDRVTGAMTFYSSEPIYETTAQNSNVSDVLVWNGQRYRVAKVWPYLSYGFYKAVGVRMAGE